MSSMELAEGARIDWWRVTEDLRKAGLTIDEQAKLCGVGKATLLGWRNLDAEPKWSDGQKLLGLWNDRIAPKVPMQQGRARYRPA